MFILGYYKVEMFDRNVNDYVLIVYGFGMYVEVIDFEDKIIMLRVRYYKIVLMYGIIIFNVGFNFC